MRPDPLRRRLLAAAVAAPFMRPAAAQEARRLTIAYPARTTPAWPLYIAKEGGYYAKHGLTAQIAFGVHPAGLAMLASGEAQVANYGLDAALIAASRDASFVMVGSPVNKGTFALIARKGIVKPEDLRGQRISVGRIGDAPYHFTVALLRKWGIGARDVQWVSAGGEPAARLAALAGGLVDAALFAAPTWFKLVDEHGFVNLGSLAEHEDIYVSVVYLFRRDAIAADPALPERLIKAHAAAVKRFYEDKAFATSAYLKHDPKASPSDTARLYDLVVRDQVLERVPFVLRDAIQSAAERSAEAHPHLKGYDFRGVVDNGTVLRLAQEGYFEALYGRSVLAEQTARMAKAYGV